MSKKLQELVQNAETIQRSFPDPTTVVVTDLEKYLFHLPADFDQSNIPANMPFDNLTAPLMEESLRTGKVNRMEVGPEKLGFPFMVTWNPVIENHKVVGLLITTTSTEKMESLKKLSTDLAVTVEQMTTTTEQVAEVSSVIVDRIVGISADSETITKTVEDVYQVIKSIRDVANQTKILGLNASIEAARAGEYGKGFTVVANEIRKMADQSKESSIHIIKFLEKVRESINQNNQSIQEISAMTEEHSASIEELNNAFSMISTAADELMNSAK